ncbi:MAG TPA: two-component regulator propeller domain-containing protein [Vicinamibacterales bacterium]|nr:two-component regulator propeller domain-containing protein [Vicinamibacterales bacterium]
MTHPRLTLEARGIHVYNPPIVTRPRIVQLALILLLIPPALGHAQRLSTKTFTTADGLANNIVNRIVRDSRGYLWFCTREGLSRFDGYTFTTYGMDDGLPGAVINDLLETNEGLYWIATNRGLVRFDPFGSRRPPQGGRPMFTTFLPGADPWTQDVWRLLQDRTGTVWVGTALGLYRLKHPVTAPITFAPIDIRSQINSLAEDGAGALWIGTDIGVFRRFPDGRLEQYTIRDGVPANDVNAILADRQGRIWIGTRSSGLAVLTADRTAQRASVAATYTTRNGLTANWINQLFEARDGTLWAATALGLAEIVTATEPSGYRFRSFGRALGLTFPAAQAITEDRMGNLWAGTVEGAAKIPATRFAAYGEADGIGTTGTLFETPGDGVLGMEMRGNWRFFRCADQRPILAPLPSAIPGWGWNQMALVDSRGDWWIGTRSGVLRYHGVSRLEQLARARPVARYTKRDGLAADVVIRLFEDSRGDVWIGTVGEGRGNGLSRWERRNRAFHHYSEQDGLPSFERFYVASFGQDRHGNVWIGFNGDGGLVRHRSDRFERFGPADGVPAGAIRNLITDARGRVWGAGYRGGLIRIDRPSDERPEIVLYTTAQGLSSNEVTAVVEDASGHIYAATGRGLDRLDPATGRIRTYRKGESLPIGEIGAAVRDRAGVLWLSHSAGVIRIVPANDLPSSPPGVVIGAVRVAGQPRHMSALGQAELEYFELPWNRNSLEIDFAAPGFGPGDGLRYQIKLEGGDAEWSSPSEQRRVAYANLAPGRYRFLARALNADGSAGTTAAVSFTILPPIWDRWWFRTAAVLLISALAYGFYRSRVSRLLEVLAVRTRIATDLHDDIGANLTRIAVLSEVVRRKGPGADDHLASIATVARESVTAMSDIVWAIGPGRSGLSDLTSRMREHAEEVFAAGDTELTFTGPQVDRHVRLSVDTRRDVYRIFKEAVNNAARHSSCSRVHITLQYDARRLILSVVDDGAGFDTASADQGNGLASMRSRAKRLGARVDINSRPGTGTTVELEIPYHRM